MTSEEFSEFYAANKDRCLRAAVASGLQPAAAEEAVAEAFARAWASWPKVRRLDHPRAWVVRTAVNADISWWRRRRREVVAPVLPDAHTEDRAHPTDLVAAIRALPPRQREVVVLKRVGKIAFADRRTRLKVPLGAKARRLIRRGRSRHRKVSLDVTLRGRDAAGNRSSLVRRGVRSALSSLRRPSMKSRSTGLAARSAARRYAAVASSWRPSRPRRSARVVWSRW